MNSHQKPLPGFAQDRFTAKLKQLQVQLRTLKRGWHDQHYAPVVGVVSGTRTLSDRTAHGILELKHGMPEHSYTSRRELEQYTFHPAVTVLAPLICILLGAMLPRISPRLDILDLPLIVTVFFAVSRRSPIAGAVTGTVIGLLQDALTDQPFGVFGISKAIIGYIGASVSFTVDVENIFARVLINFVASLLQSVILYIIRRRMIGITSEHLQPVYELIRAGVNTAVAIPIFMLLDRFKQRD